MRGIARGGVRVPPGAARAYSWARARAGSAGDHLPGVYPCWRVVTETGAATRWVRYAETSPPALARVKERRDVETDSGAGTDGAAAGRVGDLLRAAMLLAASSVTCVREWRRVTVLLRADPVAGVSSPLGFRLVVAGVGETGLAVVRPWEVPAVVVE